jgi:hypothetical protein
MPLAYLRLDDTVEDRTTMSGTGKIVFLSDTSAFIRYMDGSEEEVDTEIFVHYYDRHWII